MAETIQSMTDDALVQRLAQAERELVRQRFQLSMGQLENTSTLRTLRKEIARIKTEATRRESEQGLPKNSLLTRSTHAVDVATPSAGAPKARGGFLQGIVDKLTGDE
jgi:large subunit ribosomal protein L29